ncbi:MAG: class I SAM-dependent methyltransferase [Gammaproteobacteria bacterium]|jgi:predicted O-methyltransferase YrrM
MGKQTLDLTDSLYQYLLNVSLRDNDVKQSLRKATDELEYSIMQVSADQAQFMALLLQLINAKRILEIGTFTGYSALVMAEVLPADGKIVACDTSEEWTRMARQYWQHAGVDHKVELRLGAALDTLEQLIDEGQQNNFDAAFIDADKANIRNYYEQCLKLLRPGGLIMIDNVLWGGSVIDPDKQDDDTKAIRAVNEFIHQDERVDISLVPIGDGLTLARKK